MVCIESGGAASEGGRRLAPLVVRAKVVDQQPDNVDVALQAGNEERLHCTRHSTSRRGLPEIKEQLRVRLSISGCGLGLWFGGKRTVDELEFAVSKFPPCFARNSATSKWPCSHAM